MACRSMLSVGRNVPSGHPVVIPVVASHAISPQNGLPSTTSVNGWVAQAGASAPSGEPAPAPAPATEAAHA